MVMTYYQEKCLIINMLYLVLIAQSLIYQIDIMNY